MKEWLVFLPLILAVLLGYLGYLAWKSWKRLDELKLKDRFAARNEFIKTIAQILGGAFFLITIFFTYENLLVSEKNLAETQEKNKADLSIARDKQTTELYVKAIEQLGSDKLEVRLGGIYALERIARESPKDHWPIMEVLTAYVRENAPWPLEEPAIAQKKRPWTKSIGKGTSPPKAVKTNDKVETNSKPDTDIQVVLTVLGRTAITYAQKGEKRRLDLRATHLAGVDLIKANIQWADLRGAHLQGAFLQRANLQNAMLWNAILQGANLHGANLQHASFLNANLQRAQLTAYLDEEGWSKAKLQGADLSGTNLRGANLSRSEGLTVKQVELVIWDQDTSWPIGFSPPPSLDEEKKEGE